MNHDDIEATFHWIKLFKKYHFILGKSSALRATQLTCHSIAAAAASSNQNHLNNNVSGHHRSSVALFPTFIKMFSRGFSSRLWLICYDSSAHGSVRSPVRSPQNLNAALIWLPLSLNSFIKWTRHLNTQLLLLFQL